MLNANLLGIVERFGPRRIFTLVPNGGTTGAVTYNGLQWTSNTLPSSRNWNSVAWDGTKFLAISKDYGALAKSSDSLVWTAQSFPDSVPYWSGVAWNGIVFCAITQTYNRAYISSTGLTGSWTYHSVLSSSSWASVNALGTDFFTIPTPGYYNFKFCLSQDNGSTWSVMTIPTSDTGIISVDRGNGISVLISYSGNILISSDNIKWYQNGLANGNWTSPVWNGTFLCSFGESNSAKSFDSIRWLNTSVGSPMGGTGCIGWNGNVFCVMSNFYEYTGTSTDGETWTFRNNLTGLNAQWKKIIAIGSTFCAMSYQGGTAVSTDNGVTWTKGGGSIGYDLWGMDWNGSRFVVVTRNRYNSSLSYRSFYSTDCLTWTSGGNMPSAQYWSDVAWNGTVFCAISSGGTAAATSPTGSTWTAVTLPASDSWAFIAWNGTVFCVTSNASPGRTMVSETGSTGTWTLGSILPSSLSQHWGRAVWNGSFWTMLAYSSSDYYTFNSVLISGDGLNWTSPSRMSFGNIADIAFGQVFLSALVTVPINAVSLPME